MSLTSNLRPIEPGASIGHVHLKVSDLNRAIAFYGGVPGFDVMQRYGDEAAFLSKRSDRLLVRLLRVRPAPTVG